MSAGSCACSSGILMVSLHVHSQARFSSEKCVFYFDTLSFIAYTQRFVRGIFALWYKGKVSCPGRTRELGLGERPEWGASPAKPSSLSA